MIITRCIGCVTRASVVVLALLMVIAFQITLVAANTTNPSHQPTLSRRSRQNPRNTPPRHQLYNLGLSVKPIKSELCPLDKFKLQCQQFFDKLWANRMRLLHLFIFVKYSNCTVESILEDAWEAERNPDKYFGKKGILNRNERSVVKRRVVSSSTIRKIVGAGYTPRLVFLFGVMLRGIIHCTAIPKIFEPTIGWGAGSVFAARFAYREWIPAIMLGWFGSEYYWQTIFGVNGPPNPAVVAFDGFPITIHGVRVA